MASPKSKTKVPSSSSKGATKGAAVGKSATVAVDGDGLAPTAKPRPVGTARAPGEKRYWLVKSEPETFSIQHLAKAPKQTTFWDGVRNFQARNFLRDEMQPGDGVLFYHSSADPPGVAGLASVASAGRPDPSQFDAQSGHHDPDSNKNDPRWYGVEIKLERIFDRLVPLDEIRAHPDLGKMVLVNRSRLSVQPVTAAEFDIIRKLV